LISTLGSVSSTRFESTASLRHCSEAEIQRDIERGDILALTLADGVVAIPARQFDDAGRALPGLALVAREVGRDDPLMVALFLLTPSMVFERRTGADWLRDDRVEDVLAIARRAFRPLRS
jgi:hypothetical protein